MEQTKALNALEVRPSCLYFLHSQHHTLANVTARAPITDLFTALPRSEQVSQLSPRGRRSRRTSDLSSQHIHLRRAPRDAADPSPRQPARRRREAVDTLLRPPPRLLLWHLLVARREPFPASAQRRTKAQAPPAFAPDHCARIEPEC